MAGYVPPSALDPSGLVHANGHATGAIVINVVDELAVRDGQTYRIEFNETAEGMAYSVINEGPVTVSVLASPGKSQRTTYTNIIESSLEVRTADGRLLVQGTDYSVNGASGAINVFPSAGISAGQELFRFISIRTALRKQIASE